MAIAERTTLAFEGVVVVALDVFRSGGIAAGLRCQARLTTRGMWTDDGNLLAELHTAVRAVVENMDPEASLTAIERQVGQMSSQRLLCPEVLKHFSRLGGCLGLSCFLLS